MVGAGAAPSARRVRRGRLLRGHRGADGEHLHVVEDVRVGARRTVAAVDGLGRDVDVVTRRDLVGDTAVGVDLHRDRHQVVALDLVGERAAEAVLRRDERAAVMNCFASTGPDGTLPSSSSGSVIVDGGTEPWRPSPSRPARPAAPRHRSCPWRCPRSRRSASTKTALSWARLSAPDAYTYTPMPATRASTMAAAAINVRRFDTATPLAIRSVPRIVGPDTGGLEPDVTGNRDFPGSGYSVGGRVGLGR